MWERERERERERFTCRVAVCWLWWCRWRQHPTLCSLSRWLSVKTRNMRPLPSCSSPGQDNLCVQYKDLYSSSWNLRATERHLPYRITQSYLPPNTGERAPPKPQPWRPVLDLPTPEGWKAELTLLLGNAAVGSRTRDLSVPNPTP